MGDSSPAFFRIRCSCDVCAWIAELMLLCCAATLSLLPSDPAVLGIAKYAVAAVLGGSTVVLFGLGILIGAIQEE